ncbi:MAG TPA: MFS transporter [Candidatus Ruania gallistercoris]|uniref:MFS transporter n=1 Tax=Candidatus Ruania gallistercoris TaxID=2838746 RepID=A0A9D2EDE2_9MICO|nr:MFS transporter [Candidatus Ruania gallistercoris]
MTSPATTDVERSAVRKVAWRIVPFVALMFFINYLDRTAISFAGPNGMNDDLALTAAQFGFASGVFFIGYILLEVPSNLALHRFGARRWLSRIMVTWGIVAILFTWVQNATGLYVLRFLLGVAEAGFFPGAILFLSLWVPARYRPRVISLFFLAQPLTTVIGAPLASVLINQRGLLWGLEGWRLMFFGVAIPAILVGIIAWFYLDDGPADARWLTRREREWLTSELETEHQHKETAHPHQGVGAVFRNGKVWTLALIIFGLIYGMYALAFFLPSIIDGFQVQYGAEFGVLQEGLLTAVPYLPAAVALYFWCADATRRGVRSWHIWAPSMLGAVSVPLALFAGSPMATMFAITVTAVCIFSAMPNFWTLPTQFLTGAAAAAGVALINTVGNLAGFSAGYVTGWLRELSGGYVVPMFVVGGMLLMSAVLTMAIFRSGRVGPPASAATERTS